MGPESINDYFDAKTGADVYRLFNINSSSELLNELNDKQLTPYEYHCKNGNINVIIALIFLGCDIDNRERQFIYINGLSYLFKASRNISDNDMFNVIRLPRIRSQLQVTNKNISMAYAAAYASPAVLNDILAYNHRTLCPISDFTIYGGFTPLHSAANAGNANNIQILIYYGANPNVVDYYGSKPIFYATAKCRTFAFKILLEVTELNPPFEKSFLLAHAISGRCYDIVELLLANGANPNIFAKPVGYPITVAKNLKDEKINDLLRIHGYRV